MFFLTLKLDFCNYLKSQPPRGNGKSKSDVGQVCFPSLEKHESSQSF